jgi:L-iditol 2-dehydrogenase
MKAVVLHGPGDLRVDDVPEPTLPPGGLIVQTAYAGICGSDVRTWRHGSVRLSGAQVMGHEFAGVVVASDAAAVPVATHVALCPGAPCGACRACVAGRANLCPRRRVLGYDLPGGMAERVAIPSDWIRSGGVVALDPRRPIEAGALVEPLHTVLNGQDLARIGAGDHVLVLGLGPIGVLHVAVARTRGARTAVGVDPDVARVAGARALLGVAQVAAMDDGWQTRLREPLDGEGFDVVVVATGSAAALDSALDLVQPGGRVLAFAGLPPGADTYELDMRAMHYRQLSLIGAFGGTPATFQRAADWLTETDLDVARFAPSRFALDDALAAFESAARGDGLKTLLRVDLARS